MKTFLLRASLYSVILLLLSFAIHSSLQAEEPAVTGSPVTNAMPTPNPDEVPFPIPLAIPPVNPTNVEVITIKTSSDENAEIPFYVRKPAGYDPAIQGKTYRVLFVCPFYRGTGIGIMENKGFIKLVDTNGWFLVSPTFRMRNSEAHIRSKSYYYPIEFSGRAVLQALDEIAKKYPIDTHHLLLSGASGGGQFCHRFALWAPDRVTAVVVGSSSWFDEPSPAAAKFPWLITIGDSDPSYKNTLDFISKLNAVGALPIMKSDMGMGHSGGVLDPHLSEAFLTYYDKLTAGDLGKDTSVADKTKTTMAMNATNMPFVGDLQSWHYVTNTEENRKRINADDRIYLPSEEIAKVWGKQDE